MVSKCANPSCSAIFRYLHDGIIFHAACRPARPDKPSFSGSSINERFWLCGKCSANMTIVPKGSGIQVVPREDSSERRERLQVCNDSIEPAPNLSSRKAGSGL